MARDIPGVLVPVFRSISPPKKGGQDATRVSFLFPVTTKQKGRAFHGSSLYCGYWWFGVPHEA